MKNLVLLIAILFTTHNIYSQAGGTPCDCWATYISYSGDTVTDNITQLIRDGFDKNFKIQAPCDPAVAPCKGGCEWSSAIIDGWSKPLVGFCADKTFDPTGDPTSIKGIMKNKISAEDSFLPLGFKNNFDITYPTVISKGTNLSIGIPPEIIISELEIIDMSGRVVLREVNLQEGQNNVNTSWLKRGIYITHYKNTSGEFKAGKLMIK